MHLFLQIFYVFELELATKELERERERALKMAIEFSSHCRWKPHYKKIKINKKNAILF